MNDTKHSGVSAIVALYPNLQPVHTGGGCMALGHPLDDGGNLLITDTDGIHVPEDGDERVIVGRYGPDGNLVGGDANTPTIPVEDLEEWIDNQIAVACPFFREYQEIKFPQWLRARSFFDESWHNDAAPRAVHRIRPGLQVTVWVNHDDPTEREIPGSLKFLVVTESEYGEDCETIIETDSEAEAIAAVDKLIDVSHEAIDED